MSVVSPKSTAKLAVVQQLPLPYRIQLLQRAAGRLPLTAEGLLVGYYRSDLLPTTYVNATEESIALKGAYSDLSFEYGFPTLHDGRPFWHKFDFEPGFSFGAFQAYLELINGGPRELARLTENQELHQIASRMAGLPEGQLISRADFARAMYESSIMYYWRQRAKAFDLYKEAAYRHQRLRRQSTVEDDHYTLASNLLNTLKEKVLNTPKFFDDMAPKTAVDLLGRLVAIQRVSVGLPAAGPLANKEAPTDTSFEMIMRTLGAKAGVGNTYDQQGNAATSREAFNEVLQDAGDAGKLQEVIIRVTQRAHQQLPDASQGRTFTGRRGRNTEIISDEDLTGGLNISGAPGENMESLKAAKPGDGDGGDVDVG